MGSQNNQSFVSLPFAKFRWQLQYRVERLGIRHIKHEESYTSKASFLDGDFIPVHGEAGADQVKFSGRRFKRGLYRSKSGQVLNSDFNGSAHTTRFARVATRSGRRSWMPLSGASCPTSAECGHPRLLILVTFGESHVASIETPSK